MIIDSLWLIIIESALIAIGAGLIYGIFGGGSGLIMMPGFYYILTHFSMAKGYPMQMAVATTAASSALLGLSAVRVQAKKRNIDFSIVKRVSLGLSIGTIVAVLLLNIIPSTSLKKLFGIVVIIVSIWLITYRQEKDKKKWSITKAYNHIMSFLIGLFWFLLGVAVFTVPYLHKCNIDIRRAIGSATLISTIFSGVAAILLIITGIFQVHYSAINVGFLNIPILLSTLIPSAIAAHVGSVLSTNLPKKYLKPIYGALIFIVGLLMLI